MKYQTCCVTKIKERAKTTRSLHMCCGKDKYAGSVGIDKNPASDADVHCDLDRFPYPFGDNEFDTVICIEYGFYSKCRFKLLDRKLSLHRFFGFLEGFANRHIAFYEEVLCYVIRGKGIYLELEVVK